MPDASTPPSKVVPKVVPKVVQVMLRHTEDPARLKELLSEHLAWMRDQEREGRIFLSGPTGRADGPSLDGITVIEAASRGEADALAQQDPLVRAGVVTYSLHEWTINEGRIALTVFLSDGAGSPG